MSRHAPTSDVRWPCDDVINKLLHLLARHLPVEGMTEPRRTAALEPATHSRNSPVKRYASIVKNAVEGIFQSTPDGRYFFVNPALARLYGYDSPAELLESVTDISRSIYVDPGVRQEFKRLMVEHGEVRGLEYQIRRKDGKVIWISEHARAVTEDGVVSYYEGFIQDITRRKQAEAELRAAKEAAEVANIAKSQFLAVMSHELRTPMNGVIGIASLLQDSTLTIEQHDLVGIIRQSGDALLTIINEILDYSMIESGSVKLEREPFALRACIEAALDQVAAGVSIKGLKLEQRIARGVPLSVIGDAGRLQQLLVNLLGNAVKFTAKGGITLSVYPADRPTQRIQNQEASGKDPAFALTRLAFSIVDTGIGIAPEALGKLFQPFSQVDASTTRRYGGTGLGLAMSKRLVNLMGGELSVESVPGRGSHFRFTVGFLHDGPSSDLASHRSLSEPGEEAEVSATASSGISSAGSRHRILLAEDNLVNQKVAQRILATLGYGANMVINGLQVLEAVAVQYYDIILLDLQMPEMDGLETARELRGRNYPPGLRPWIIAVTANAMAGDRELCLAAGMDDYITKPLKRSELAAALERAARTDLTK